MEFEWDERKRLANLAKHYVDFRIALFLFDAPYVTEPDLRQDYGEDRFIATGFVDGDCYVVAYTVRNEAIRLISAWKGGRNDRRKYQALHDCSAAGDA